ncbi:MAG: glycosyltransferase family 2 protein [Muribaculaceae bacterium]|nr:glycosyltransferase family 2 protein [Muribaculaceae bacterium]
MNKDKLSIIIPAYNVGAYINECLDSIERQTYQNIEIIIVDDGSKDDTYAIVKRRAEESKLDYKIFTQKNSGQSSARNRGLREASGKYIVFVDSDDWLPTSDILEKMYNAIEETGCDYIQGGVCFVKNGEKTKEYLPKRKNVLPGSEILVSAITLDSLYTGPIAKIYNTTFLKSNSLYFMEGLVNEDTAHSIMIAANAKTVGFINDCVYYIREVEGSTSRADFKRMITTMHEVLSRTENYLYSLNKFEGVKNIFYARYLRSMLYNLLQSSQRLPYNSFLADWKFCMTNTNYLKYRNYSKFLPSAHKLLYKLSKYPKVFYYSFRGLNQIGIKMH